MSTLDLPVISDVSITVFERLDGFYTAEVVSISGKLGLGVKNDGAQFEGLQALRTRTIHLKATSRSRRMATVHLLRAIADEIEGL